MDVDVMEALSESARQIVEREVLLRRALGLLDVLGEELSSESCRAAADPARDTVLALVSEIRGLLGG